MKLVARIWAGGKGIAPVQNSAIPDEIVRIVLRERVLDSASNPVREDPVQAWLDRVRASRVHRTHGMQGRVVPPEPAATGRTARAVRIADRTGIASVAARDRARTVGREALAGVQRASSARAVPDREVPDQATPVRQEPAVLAPDRAVPSQPHRALRQGHPDGPVAAGRSRRHALSRAGGTVVRVWTQLEKRGTRIAGGIASRVRARASQSGLASAATSRKSNAYCSEQLLLLHAAARHCGGKPLRGAQAIPAGRRVNCGGGNKECTKNQRVLRV